MATPNESTFELTTIERLRRLGYRYLPGGEIDRDLHTVVLEAPLRTYLQRRYRHPSADSGQALPETAIEQAVQTFSAPEGASLDRHNLARYRSFRQMLDEAITRYNNRTIQAADVVQIMVEIRRQQLEDERRKQELGLSDEELPFYDVIMQGAAQGIPTDDEWIAGLVQDVVKAVRGNLSVDWTKAHRRDVYASVVSAVKMVLRRRRIKGEAFQFLLARLMQQAEASYEDWPMAA